MAALKVAVFGSRKGVDLEAVGHYLADRRADVDSTVLVSGGAQGVDRYAEQTWRSLGGRVVSFRPYALSEEEFGVECWEFGGGQDALIYKMLDHPTFATYAGACIYRDLLIAEYADRGVAFRANRSRGTGHTIYAFGVEGKPCVVKEER